MIPKEAKLEIIRKRQAGVSWTAIALWVEETYGIKVHWSTIRWWYDKEGCQESEVDKPDIEQIKIDLCVMNFPVVILGVGTCYSYSTDGPTHHGVFDIVFMCSLPGMIVTAPKDGNELRNLLATGIQSNKNFSIRYPKETSIIFDETAKAEILQIGKWESLVSGEYTVILAVGSTVGMIMESIVEISDEIGYSPSVVNARFIKPIDKQMLHGLCEEHQNIITICIFSKII